MRRRLFFSPEALSQLDDLDDYLSRRAGPAVAAPYLDRLLDFCADIASEPVTGHRRDDLLPGLVTRTFEKQRVICYIEISGDVHIVAIYGTRQSWEHQVQKQPPTTPPP